MKESDLPPEIAAALRSEPSDEQQAPVQGASVGKEEKPKRRPLTDDEYFEQRRQRGWLVDANPLSPRRDERG